MKKNENFTAFTVTENDLAKRLDIFCSEKIEFSRSFIKKEIEKNNILVNNEKVKAGYILKLYDEVKIIESLPMEMSFEGENIPLDIIYEDMDIAVINKAQGMVTHPAEGAYSGTLVNALIYHFKNISHIDDCPRSGIVHRLDKNTSGLIVVAKNNKAHENLSNQIANRSVTKIYVALVDGNIKEDELLIDKPIARSKKDRKKMVVDNLGRKAVTKIRVLERYGRYTLIECELLTGRTHQIRVHCSNIKHSIVGDEVYGGSMQLYTKGQLLHSKKLIIKHPSTKMTMEFTADIPNYFKDILSKIENLRK